MKTGGSVAKVASIVALGVGEGSAKVETRTDLAGDPGERERESARCCNGATMVTDAE